MLQQLEACMRTTKVAHTQSGKLRNAMQRAYTKIHKSISTTRERQLQVWAWSGKRPQSNEMVLSLVVLQDT